MSKSHSAQPRQLKKCEVNKLLYKLLCFRVVGYSIIDTWNTKVRVRLQAKNSYKCRPGVMRGWGSGM